MRYFFPLLFVFIFCHCKNEKPPSPFSHIADNSAKEVLEKAIAQSGGWENFQNIDSLFYEKRTVLFDSLGKVESDVLQKHIYQVRPGLAMSISWENEEGTHRISRKKNECEKFLNDKKIKADSVGLLRSTNAALYTLFMPWKLLDPGVELKYKGIVKLPGGNDAHAISAIYFPEKKNNHSTKDDWEYYFEKDTYKYMACMVDHHDYFALIVNEEKSKSGGLVFNAYRNSYRVDKDRNILWKRGEFYYENIIAK